MFSKLPTTEYLYARDSSLRDSKNVISLTHFTKDYTSYAYKRSSNKARLAALCVAYNVLTGEQQQRRMRRI